MQFLVFFIISIFIEFWNLFFLIPNIAKTFTICSNVIQKNAYYLF